MQLSFNWIWKFNGLFLGAFSLQGTLLKMVENTTSSFDGLKIILFHLFNEEELRTSSLKGVTTIAGGANSGINKEKLNLLYGT